jgi:predicted nucleotidyltransferase component of viral defense system
MKLHFDKKLFQELIKLTSNELKINPIFVEKDYWITLVLSRLAKSKYFDASVFKGGTSLSKGYKLIERFSEDLDIAIINETGKTGSEIKTIIRKIEKEITCELTELQIAGVTSKGSRFRKSVFEYVSTDKSNQNNKLILEVNSFANPFPFQRLSIQSFVFDFLMDTGNEKYIEQYNLQSFELNVLSKEQTLIEKMVSLIRFSFEKNAVESISKKIRHFYDLYFLMKNSECADFVASHLFKKQFDSVLQHDNIMFDEPKEWHNKPITESPLVNNFSTIWKQLKVKYQTELSALAYRTIPDEESVAKNFIAIIKRIE